MKFRWLLLAVCLLGTVSGRADESPGASTSPAPVTDEAQVRDHYRQVLAGPEYQEIEESDVNAHFKDWLSQWITRLEAKFGQFKYASEMPVFTSLLMTLLVVLSITGLLYVMVRLTRRRSGMETESPGDVPGQKTFRAPEFYDKEIDEAIRAGDWHGAWLAAWRQFLSRLENRRLVEADRTRTNREYLAQLRVEPLPAPALVLLTVMVDAYDRFIYGRKSIGESDWNLFHRQINETSLLLHLNDKSAGFRSGPGGT